MRIATALLALVFGCSDAAPIPWSSDPYDRKDAIRAIAQGSNLDAARVAIGQLLQHDPDASVRNQAVMELTKLGTSHLTTALLVDRLVRTDEAPQVRVASAVAVNTLGPPEAVPMLISMLHPARRGDVHGQTYAGYALVGIGTAAVDDLMAIVLARGDRLRRLEALRILRRIRDSSVRTRLRPLLDEPDDWIRDEARQIIDE